MPGFRSFGVPEPFRDHPLLAAGPFFTLPTTLLRLVVAEVGEDRFDDDLLAMEYSLSAVCQEHNTRIGFWRQQPICFQLLRPGNALTDDFLVKGMAELLDKTGHEARATLATAGQRLDWTHEVLRGYCGWLMTNRDFLDEHQKILDTWQDEVAESGIPAMGPVVRDAKAVPRVQRAEGKMGAFLGDFEEFFIRWRLDAMPAPFVPQPMGVHLPVVDLRPVLGHMRRGGTTFYLPDICSVPSRDKLRDILEEALRNRSAPDYLAEWFDVVHSHNVAKNQIPRYARIFEIQHDLRALYARHASALRRKKSALTTALAGFFDVSDDAIERDLRLIASRLGRDWYLGTP